MMKPSKAITNKFGKRDREECLAYLNNFSCFWTQRDVKAGKSAIRNINLQIKKVGLIAIIGKTGGGKSTLVQSLLQKVPFYTGRLKVGRRVSYTGHQPFVFPGTIKENILFEDSDADTATKAHGRDERRVD